MDKTPKTNITPSNVFSQLSLLKKSGLATSIRNCLLGIQPHLQALFLIAFLLPFAPRLVPYALCVFFITSLISGSVSGMLKEMKCYLILQSGILFFLIFFFSALFAQNKGYAFELVSTKLGLLIFPVLFSVIPPKQVTPKIISITALFFILGSMWGTIECFAFSINNYIQEISANMLDKKSLGTRHFLAARFSRIMHPSYFTLYLDLCLLFLFFNSNVYRWLGKKTVFVVSGLFSFTIILLASKAGIICTLLMYVYIAYNFIIRERKWMQATLLLVSFGSIFLCVLFIAPELGGRFTEMSGSLSEGKLNSDAEKSSALRMLVWHASLELISENPVWGVGIEHTHDAQISKYAQLGYEGAEKYELNAHNQFLQTAVMAGILGLIILLVWLGSAIKHFFVAKDNVALIFMVLVAFNMQVEAILEAQTGVLFIAFWIYLFWASTKTAKTQFQG